jgi:hypothetical protein
MPTPPRAGTQIEPESESTMVRRILKSRKGTSLVELIAVMAISVVVTGAALTVLFSGSRSATDGAEDFGSHSNASLLENWLCTNLPNAAGVSTGTGDHSGVSGYTLYFTGDSENNFVIAKDNAPVLNIRGIQSFTVSTAAVGKNQTFRYRITAESGGRTFVLSGGVVLNNISAENLAIPSEIQYDKLNKGYIAVS